MRGSIHPIEPGAKAMDGSLQRVREVREGSPGGGDGACADGARAGADGPGRAVPQAREAAVREGASVLDDGRGDGAGRLPDATVGRPGLRDDARADPGELDGAVREDRRRGGRHERGPGRSLGGAARPIVEELGAPEEPWLEGHRSRFSTAITWQRRIGAFRCFRIAQRVLCRAKRWS